MPAGATVYVNTNNGFDMFIVAAFQAKHVPLKVVPSRDRADYMLDSSLFHDSGAFVTTKGGGTYRISEAAFELTRTANGDIVWRTRQPRECSAGAGESNP